MLLTIFLLLIASVGDVISSSKNREAYTVGLFPDPIYDAATIDSIVPPINVIQYVYFTVKFSNVGNSSETVRFSAYLPENAEIWSFSMITGGTSYAGRQSHLEEAENVMNKALKENHNAVVYIPQQLSDFYDQNYQTTASRMHIKSKQETYFNLGYTENVSDMDTGESKRQHQALVVIDHSGVIVEDIVTELSSPNYPRPYPNNAAFKWLIRVPSEKIVLLQIKDLWIEDCCDRLMVYDGVSMQDKVIAEITGHFENLTKTNFQSTSNALFLRLMSDCSKSFQGFRLTTSAVSKEISSTPPPATASSSPLMTFSQVISTEDYICENNTYLYATPHDYRDLTSPGYPNFYPNDIYCSWIIRADYEEPEEAYILELRTVDSYIEFHFDFLYIYDGNSSTSPLLAKLDRLAHDPVYSSGPFLYVIFYTDSSYTLRGFHLKYKAIRHDNLACITGEHIQLYDGDGYILSLNYPSNYDNNLHCSWYIHGHNLGYVVRLYGFNNISIASGDELSVYDGRINKVLALFTAESFNPNSSSYIDSKSMDMNIVFVSDNSHQDKGFALRYSAHYSPNTTQLEPTESSSPNCDDAALYLTAYTYSRSFTSLGYQSGYQNDLCQEWTITAFDNGFVILLAVLDLDLEECCDFVYLLDGNTTSSDLIAKLSGSLNENNFRSTGMFMHVTFKTDYSITGKGFRLGYEETFPSTTTPSTTTFPIISCFWGRETTLYENQSGFVDSNYEPAYLPCSWQYRAYDPSYVVQIEFQYLALRYDDRLNIYDGPSQFSPVLANYNSKSLRPDEKVSSSGQYIFITFSSEELHEGIYSDFIFRPSIAHLNSSNTIN